MRVISGKLRGAKLFGPEEYQGTRPISDRARQAMFNILDDRVRGAKVLDLFAGTGSVGIEALSRDAAHATFVELHEVPATLIRKNLAKTRLTEKARIVRADVFPFLRSAKDSYDIVFCGPPQWKDLWRRSLEAMDQRPSIFASGAVLVLQCDPSEYAPLPLLRLEEFDRRKYGSVLLTFFRPVEARPS